MGGVTLSCVFDHRIAGKAGAGARRSRSGLRGRNRRPRAIPRSSASEIRNRASIRLPPASGATTSSARANTPGLLDSSTRLKLSTQRNHAGPLHAAMVERSFNAVARKRLADQALQTFHARPQFPASKERDCQPSDRGIFHSLTCQLSSLPGRSSAHCTYVRTRERPPHQQNPPKERVNLYLAGPHRVTSTSAPALCFLTLAQLRHAFVLEALKALWDANSTPVCWGCQEGIPIYCISILTSGMPPPALLFHKRHIWNDNEQGNPGGTTEPCHPD